MAAPTNPPHPPPPLSPFDPTGQLFFGYQAQHQLPDTASTSTSAVPNPPAGRNYDRMADSAFIPPPLPPMPPSDDHIPPVGGEEQRSLNPDGERPADVDESDHSDSEGEDEQRDQFQWQPLDEDKSEPCEDELVYAAAKGEHSATEAAYWQSKMDDTLNKLNDKELVAGESGRIDLLVEKFNGTREEPNKEYIIRSDIVSIGGYDWRIKFYPRGDNTEYLSIYVECVTIPSDDHTAFVNFEKPPLPSLEGMEMPKRPNTVCAQLVVVMYNPAEPRTNWSREEAHQFTKSKPDQGWTRFSRLPRRDFVYRDHGERQAIYRNDKLAFAAYIRIVQDPTGCLWSHGDGGFDDSIALTSLRPFAPQRPMFAAELPLLHFAPFREFIYQWKDTRIVFWMQTLLWKMMSRKRSQHYGEGLPCVQSDTVAWLRFLANALRKETDPARVNELIGRLDPENGAAIGSNRLKTKKCASVQEAVNAHPSGIETPALLTLELERQEFDTKTRRWEKLTNPVALDDTIIVSGASYTLYAFATHCGDLESNRFNLLVRPNGPSQLWYKYSDGSVRCLTHKQAVIDHVGVDKPPKAEAKVKRRSHYRYEPEMQTWRYDEPREVAHVVMYVRDDHQNSLISAPAFESWDVPQTVKDGNPPEVEGEEKEQPPAIAVEDPIPPPDAPVVEPPAADTPVVDAPVLDAPVVDAAVVDAPVVDAPVVDAPVEDAGAVPEGSQSDSDSHRDSFDIDAGYATPSRWAMDGDDVVMSDADDDTDFEHGDTEKEPEVHTIDVLGREYYHGHLADSAYHGNGHLISMNGDVYIGEFKHGLKEGQGKMTYSATGNVYEGAWLEGEQHGFGKLIEASTGNVFEGGWKHGKKHGEFVLKGTVTEEDKGCCSICYDREINTAFYDCGHVIACKDCAGKIESCPICRKRVLARLELFGVKMTFE